MNMNRRQRRREARRREMLDAAMELIVDEGLESLTIARLASSLAAAVGALYRYFPGKQGLLTALQKRAIASLHQQMLAELDAVHTYVETQGLSAEDGAMLACVVMFTAYLRDIERDAARHRLIDRMMSSPTPVLTDEQARQVNEVLAPIILTCAKACDDLVD